MLVVSGLHLNGYGSLCIMGLLALITGEEFPKEIRSNIRTQASTQTKKQARTRISKLARKRVEFLHSFFHRSFDRDGDGMAIWAEPAWWRSAPRLRPSVA